MTPPTRRAVCAWLAAAACAPGDTDSPDASNVDLTDGTWWPVPLADHPALGEVGGAEVVDVPEAYLHVVVAQVEPDRFVAVWAICSHGACAVSYFPDNRALDCPCHGSRFGEDGSVLRGPATRALASFPAIRVDDVVWVQRAA